MRLRTFRHAALVVAAASLLAACTSATGGTGRVGGSARPGTNGGEPDFPNDTGSGDGSGGGSGGGSRSSGTSSPYARAARSTVIGDPATADLCTAIDATTVTVPGYTTALNGEQYPPGCSVRLSYGATGFLVNVYAATRPPRAEPGRTTRVVSGLQVYVYVFSGGDCERDIVTRDLGLKVHTYGASSKGAACAAADAVTARMAGAIGSRNIPRLGLATPTLVQLDYCAVIRALDRSSLATLGRATLAAEPFDIGCDLTVGKTTVFVNTRLDRGATKVVPRTVGGHQIYVEPIGSDCVTTSVQGTASNGYREALVMQTASSGSASASLCTETASMLALFLDKVGRK